MKEENWVEENGWKDEVVEGGSRWSRHFEVASCGLIVELLSRRILGVRGMFEIINCERW